MKLFILGATGKTGSEILTLALARGHEVTAFVRSPQKLVPQQKLQIIAGDPKDTAALQRALPNHDAVLSAIGAPPREALRPSTLMAECAASTVAAMTSAGLSRVVFVSAAALFPGEGLQIRFFQWLLQHHIRDLRTMETIISASNLQWTILRPPRLVKNSGARYRAQRGALPPGPLVTSFRSVAACMLDRVEKGDYMNEIVGLTRETK